MENNSFSKIETAILKILSLLIAIALWIFVSYTINPEMEKTFRNVKIEYVFPKSEQIVLLNEYPEEADIVLEGKRNDIIALQKDELRVYVDLRNADLGLQTFNLEIHTPLNKDFVIVEKEFDTVTLDVDRKIEKTFPVKIRKKPFEDKNRWLDITLEPDTVTVFGSKSYINEINEIYMECNSQEIEKNHRDVFNEKGISIAKIFYPVMIDGKIDESMKSKIEPDVNYVSLHARIMYDKVLALDYNEVKLSDENLLIASQKLSQNSLKFKGLESEIKEIDVAKCKIDAVDEIKQPGLYKLRVRFDVPKSLEPKNGEEVYLILDVKERGEEAPL